MFVYLIENMANGKFYVGQTVQQVRKRFSYHMNLAERGKGCRRLRSAIQSYGRKAFSFQILSKCNSLEELSTAEQLWIIALDSSNPEYGYNLSSGGESGSRGFKWSEESRLKLSRANKGNKRCSGRKHSAETKQKISQSLMGHTQKPNRGSFKPGLIPWNKNAYSSSN